MNNKEDRKIKPISFNLNNKNDVELLEHVENSGKSFGTYIKALIRKDMHEGNTNNSDVVEAINNIARILESKSFKIEQECQDHQEEHQKNNEQKLNNEDQESKNIISNLMGLGGKK